MKIKSFRDLEIWIEAKKIVIDVFKITNSDKFKWDLSLKDQIRKSAVSIPSNISEGFERDSNNELIHYLRIAKGSCAELITQLEIAIEIRYLEKKSTLFIIKQLEVLNARIGKFISYLLKN